jgi:phage N-6-adenine-methyltransferase
MRARNDDNPTPKDLQRTPPKLFHAISDILDIDFEIDVAATSSNKLCGLYYSNIVPENDITFLGNALDAENWPRKSSWMNPPYSNPLIWYFMHKAYLESLKGVVVVALVQCDMSTGWWDYCMNAAEWIRIKGRVQFLNDDGTPTNGCSPFASIAVEFNAAKRKENKGKVQISELKHWK